MLAPLTELMSIKVKFKWTQIEQDVFDEIKRIVSRNTLSAYQDFNEEFNIHTNASNLQLWAFIIQKGKTIAFYSVKLADAQKVAFNHRWNSKGIYNYRLVKTSVKNKVPDPGGHLHIKVVKNKLAWSAF